MQIGHTMNTTKLQHYHHHKQPQQSTLYQLTGLAAPTHLTEFATNRTDLFVEGGGVHHHLLLMGGSHENRLPGEKRGEGGGGREREREEERGGK